MVTLGQHPQWVSALALGAMGVAGVCVLVDLALGTGGWLLGIVLVLLGVGLVLLGFSGEGNRRRLRGLWMSVFAYTGLVLGFVLAITGLAMAGSSISSAEGELPTGFGGFVYQVGNGLGGLFILLSLVAAAYSAWAYLSTRRAT